MSAERGGYGFSPQDKQMVHERAQGMCEFPADPCPRPNRGVVDHITGVYEARLSGMPREVVHDPDLNALMLCEPHAFQHDVQERFQVNSLLAERWKSRGTTLYERKHNRSARTHRRRR